MKYDAVVIGSGQAGNPLAHRLADRGWKVALVEKKHLGGTCINTGCTPTKTMVHRAQVAHYARQAARWGVRARDVSVDLPAIVAQKDEVVRSFRSGQEKQVFKRPGLHLCREHARFVGPRAVMAGGETLESEKFFLDVGGRPLVPAIPGLADAGALTNESILELTDLPSHLLVLGGGYIGLEFAQMFHRFGSRVTVVHSGPRIASREDPEIAAELAMALASEGIEIWTGAKTTAAEKRGRTIALSVLRDGKTAELTGSHLLLATGRIPNSDGLDLEKAGVETDEKGYIRVNGRLETTAKGIWALGDVKGGPAFTHIAYNDFQIVFGNLVEGQNLSIDGRIVPYCMFTDPQLGGVGLTEAEARASGFKLKIGRAPMSGVARAIERGETAGLMKMIVDAETDQVLGASILGVEGGEVVQILSMLMRARLPYTLLKGAVYIHPTMAEGLYNLMESVAPAEP